MATEVKLPRLGQGMESGTIVRWLKAEGDAVSKSEPLYELDTDKVTQEVEAEADGVLLKILVADGEVEVGTTVAVIGAEGEDRAATTPRSAPSRPAPAPAGAARRVAEPADAEVARRAAAPTAAGAAAARRTAASRHPRSRAGSRASAVSTSPRVAGTGPDGRIIAEDVERPRPRRHRRACGRPGGGRRAAPGEVEVIQLTSTRKTIARRLTEAWTAPVFQLGVAVDMTEVLALREQLVDAPRRGRRRSRRSTTCSSSSRPSRSSGTRRSTRRSPARRSTATRRRTSGSPSRRRTGSSCPSSATPTASRSRRSPRPAPTSSPARATASSRSQDMEGGTFTISNLGMFGVEQFAAVLNPPQVAILAVGAVKDEAGRRRRRARHRADRSGSPSPATTARSTAPTARSSCRRSSR